MSENQASAGSPQTWLSEAEAALRENHQRMTTPRRAVMGVLAVADRPLKAEEIRVGAGLGEGDLVTVYRNLESLRTLGLIQRIILENGVQLFEAVRSRHHFHHIVCRHCHQTEEIHVCFGHDLERHAMQAGFTDVDHVIEVFGLCPDCQQADTTSNKQQL